METGVADMEFAIRWEPACFVMLTPTWDAKEESHLVCSIFIINSREMCLKLVLY